MNETRIIEIKKCFEQYSGTITAFSGGIDSALVLLLSRRFLGRERAIGVISNSESLKEKDYQLAVEFASKNNIQLETVYTPELSDLKYSSNPTNRCYFCKTHLYASLSKVKLKFPEYTVLNGTNKDDYKDYRPGMKAADENEVESPLAVLGMGKEEIRKLAKHFEIPFWQKPASPCLSSRIPYGNSVTANKLNQIEKAEGILNDFGFNDVRVRHFGETCKIEVPLNDLGALQKIAAKVTPLIKELGFSKCIIDEEGLVSGKLNRVLNLKNG